MEILHQPKSEDSARDWSVIVPRHLDIYFGKDETLPHWDCWLELNRSGWTIYCGVNVRLHLFRAPVSQPHLVQGIAKEIPIPSKPIDRDRRYATVLQPNGSWKPTACEDLKKGDVFKLHDPGPLVQWENFDFTKGYAIASEDSQRLLVGSAMVFDTQDGEPPKPPRSPHLSIFDKHNRALGSFELSLGEFEPFGFSVFLIDGPLCNVSRLKPGDEYRLFPESKHSFKVAGKKDQLLTIEPNFGD